jgi:hypothetical protein
VDWIHMAKHRDQCKVLVKMVMKLRVQLKAMNLLTEWLLASQNEPSSVELVTSHSYEPWFNSLCNILCRLPMLYVIQILRTVPKMKLHRIHRHMEPTFLVHIYPMHKN